MTDKLRQKRWKMALTVVTLGALVATSYALRHQIVETIENLGQVNTWAVLLVIPLEGLNNLSQAKLYQALFRLLGDRFRTKPLFGLSLELNMVNNIFPSGGVSGFSYLSLRLRSENISTAKATLVQMMRFIMVFLSFQVLLFVGLILLALGGDASRFTVLVAGSLSTLVLVGTLLMGFIIGSKTRINNFFIYITRFLNKVIHLVRPNHPETININKAHELFTELHDNYMILKSRYTELKRPLIYALLANLTEVTAIYAVYLAFGHVVNPGAVVLAYAVANLAGLVAVLPGGIGVYEGLMTGVLAAGGVSPAVSLPVTVMYRVVSMAAQLPPGYFLYHRALHGKSPIPEE